MGMTEEEKAAVKREGHLKRTYGITTVQYESLLERQSGACGVCRKDASEFSTRLAVDHDHKTGEIRGLLCNYCNHRLIGRHRCSALLRAMADYLDVGTGWFVPEKKKRKKRGSTARRQNGKRPDRSKRGKGELQQTQGDV